MKKILLTMMAAGLITTGFAIEDTVSFKKLGTNAVEESAEADVQLVAMSAIQEVFIIADATVENEMEIMNYCIKDTTGATDSTIGIVVSTSDDLTDVTDSFAMQHVASGDKHAIQLKLSEGDYASDKFTQTLSESNAETTFYSSCSSGSDSSGKVSVKIPADTVSEDNELYSLTVTLEQPA